MSTEYGADQIQILEGLEAVRKRPGMYIVSNDDVAAGVMNSMSDGGINVPEQFEVATSDNTKLTEMTRPMLSTITQPLYDIGAVSMRLLTKLMKNEEVSERNILLPFGLKDRNSTK